MARSLLLQVLGRLAEKDLTLIGREPRIIRLGSFGSFRPLDRLIAREDIPGSVQETAVSQASRGCVLFGAS